MEGARQTKEEPGGNADQKLEIADDETPDKTRDLVAQVEDLSK